MAGVGFLAEQPAAETDRRPYGLKSVGGQFLRHQPDQAAGLAVIDDDVMAVDLNAAFRRVDDAADDTDQRRLAGAVGTQKRENFPTADIQADILQRLKAGVIGFRQVGDGYERVHGRDTFRLCRHKVNYGNQRVRFSSCHAPGRYIFPPKEMTMLKISISSASRRPGFP